MTTVVGDTMASDVAQSPVAIRRLARWRCDGVLYETHLARLAGGITGIVLSALGPGRRHRCALMPDDCETIRLAEGRGTSHAELTEVAEAYLLARSA